MFPAGMPPLLTWSFTLIPVNFIGRYSAHITGCKWSSLYKFLGLLFTAWKRWRYIYCWSIGIGKLDKKYYILTEEFFISRQHKAVPEDEFTAFLLQHSGLYYDLITHCKQGSSWELHCPGAVWEMTVIHRNSFLSNFHSASRKAPSTASALSSSRNDSVHELGYAPLSFHSQPGK